MVETNQTLAGESIWSLLNWNAMKNSWNVKREKIFTVVGIRVMILLCGNFDSINYSAISENRTYSKIPSICLSKSQRRDENYAKIIHNRNSTYQFPWTLKKESLFWMYYDKHPLGDEEEKIRAFILNVDFSPRSNKIDIRS